MARKPFTETVPVVLGVSCKIDGRDRFSGETVNLSRQDAADMKSLRMARDLTADEMQRGGYMRRDMQAG